MSEVAVDPTRDDPLLIPATEGLGGPLGAHAWAAFNWWTPIRVILLALGGALTVGYLQKAPCRDPSRWADQFQLTHACYTDVLASWGSFKLISGAIPYVDFATPYPTLTGVFMEVAARLTGLMPVSEAQRVAAYFDISVVLLSALAVIAVVTTALLSPRRRPWDALMLAVAPVMILQAFTNWDLLPVALLGIAMVAWSRGAPAWAGMWLGLATAAKFWPLLLLLALVLLCWRAGRMREWFTIVLTTVMTWAAVSIPVWLFAPAGFGEFWAHNLHRGADWDSLWLPIEKVTGWETGRATDLRVLAALIVATVAVAVLVWKAPRRPRVPQIMFVLLALFLVVGKVFSPQDALWLTPLAVLARPRWRAFLVWQAAEVLLTINRLLMLVGLEKSDKGLPDGWWYVTVAVRDISLLVLVGFVVWDIWDSRRDVVRDDGVDDPAGGPLDEAADRRERARASESDSEPMPV